MNVPLYFNMQFKLLMHCCAGYAIETVNKTAAFVLEKH